VTAGNIHEHDAYHAFNMGVGMCVIVPASAVAQVTTTLPEARVIGEVIAGEGVYFQ
jgi:phosphoribosylformylglycinamidine cyclo-ligase